MPEPELEPRFHPSAHDIANGVMYVFTIDFGRQPSGEIYQSRYDKPLLLYGPEAGRPIHEKLNLFARPPVIFTDFEGSEKLRIVRASRFPLTFEILAPMKIPSQDQSRAELGCSETPKEKSSHRESQRVGTIRRITLLRTKYTISLDGDAHWIPVHLTFHMPLFKTRFRGRSREGHCVWARIRGSQRDWHILREPSLNHPYLLHALAFIHHEYWCFT
jgi:hypothetical protein